MIPASVLDKPPSAELRARSDGHRLAAALRGARPDHRGLRRRRPVGRRAHRARPRRRRSCGGSRAWSTATSTSAARRRRACGCRPRRSARTAGCRSPTAGPAERVAGPERAIAAAGVGDRAAAAARARADRGDDRVRRDVQARAERARRRHAGRFHPVAVRDRRDRAARRSRSATAGVAADRASTSRRSRDVPARRRSRSASIGFAGYWFQNDGLAAHDDVQLRVHHRVVRGVHAAHRDRGRPGGRRRRNVMVAVAFSVGRACSCSKVRTFDSACGRRAHARVRVHVRALDPRRRRTSRSASTRSRSPRARWWCSRCCAVPVVRRRRPRARHRRR